MIEDIEAIKLQIVTLMHEVRSFANGAHAIKDCKAKEWFHELLQINMAMIDLLKKAGKE